MGPGALYVVSGRSAHGAISKAGYVERNKAEGKMIASRFFVTSENSRSIGILCKNQGSNTNGSTHGRVSSVSFGIKWLDLGLPMTCKFSPLEMFLLAFIDYL